MTFRGKPDEVTRQAADWLARLHADDRAQEDDAAFRAWLGADPGHGAAFERASAVWDWTGGLKDQPIAPAPSPPHSRPIARRAVLAGGAAVIVAAGTALGWREATAGVHETAVGEQRRLVLEDGTRVMLDTATRIRFRAGGAARSLWLSAGRVDLAIASDPRPFLVDTGARRVVAEGGRLDVRRDGDRVALTAVDGSARVETGGAPMALVQGSRIAMEAGRPDRLDRPELEDLIAWQSGRLVFRDETLARAIAEMNRYSRRPLVAADAATGQLRLSGMYRVGDTEAFARSLAILLPVRVEADAAAIRIRARG